MPDEKIQNTMTKSNSCHYYFWFVWCLTARQHRNQLREGETDISNAISLFNDTKRNSYHLEYIVLPAYMIQWSIKVGSKNSERGVTPFIKQQFDQIRPQTAHVNNLHEPCYSQQATTLIVDHIVGAICITVSLSSHVFSFCILVKLPAAPTARLILQVHQNITYLNLYGQFI